MWFSESFLLCFIIAVQNSKGTLNGIVRGVDPSRREFYKINEPFTCLDKSQIIEWHKVNDDYCDCSDGSDEPGTSACNSGFYYCENKDYIPLMVPSSRVNDGICDCCDGSDEYSGITTCVNVCLDLGQAAREEQQARQRLQRSGLKKHTESRSLIEEKLAGHRARLQELEQEIHETQAQKQEAENRKHEAEVPEKEALERHGKAFSDKKASWLLREDSRRREMAFQILDANQDGRLDLEEIKHLKTFDIDNSGEVSDEEAKEYLKDADSVDYETFVSKVWPGMKELYYSIVETRDGKGDTSSSLEHEDPEPREEEQDQATKQLVEAAIEARRVTQELSDKLLNLEDMKRDLENLIHLDYGSDLAYFLLADSKECFESEEQEYIYKLCPFREVTQRSKESNADSGETSLGLWSRWEDGHKIQIYENGLGCWNGPNRNTKIRIECGAENKLENVIEPNRCEYAMTFKSPAACVMEALNAQQHPSPSSDIHKGHEEL